MYIRNQDTIEVCTNAEHQMSVACMDRQYRVSTHIAMDKHVICQLLGYIYQTYMYLCCRTNVAHAFIHCFVQSIFTSVALRPMAHGQRDTECRVYIKIEKDHETQLVRQKRLPMPVFGENKQYSLLTTFSFSS